jgi:catechol 2,3-dioxygenase-like lactoylglutathione lyase family enzyme
MTKPTPPFALADAELVSFLATTAVARCRQFYEQKLGLQVVHEEIRSLTLLANGRPVRVQLVARHTPQQFTVLGWNVKDIDATVAALAAAGVRCEMFGSFPQSPEGIATFPDGARVAWFKDPDGNVLSVSQAR